MKRVHIELQRVQSWLFAVPRLRAMVGANSLLGETLRVELPKLAREAGHLWTLKQNNGEAYPDAHPDDPLQAHDDPGADARDGILARDGGHFEAQFANGADAFADAAEHLIRTTLPGLRFRITVDGEQRTRNQVCLSTELPVLAPCEWTGRGLASTPVAQGDELCEVSLDVARRHKVAKLNASWKMKDVASLLGATTRLKLLDPVQELKELAGNGYLALIHADGNGVGSGIAKDSPDSVHAAFFHMNRVILRRAVKDAIDDACDKDVAGKGESPAPLVPLMLGGDDLLLVCRAQGCAPLRREAV
ncbi:hypothetical protein [Planctomicrobium sp. SH664]|uniref:hypothetical protein n=1 Tax=Planctomicrobium sp. SH664 TaxID=3448125 RepID=UPI003F5C0EA7